MSHTVHASHHHDGRALFVEVGIVGKGRGLQAKDHIAKGTCVLAENPLISPGDYVYHQPIIDFYNTLQEPDQQWFWGLIAHPNEDLVEFTEFRYRTSWSELPESLRHIFCIYWTNRIEGRLFRQSSRINHSCAPNLFYAWNRNTGKGQFHATRDITPGEELTRSYVPIESTSLQYRQFLLEKEHGFKCTCEACTDIVAVRWHDEKAVRFVEDRDFLERQEQHPEHADWAECKKIAIKMADLCTSKPSLPCLRFYRLVAKFNWYLGEPRNTVHWMDRELKMQEICIGPHHPIASRIHRVREKVKAAMDDQAEYKKAKGERSLQNLIDLSRACPQEKLCGLKARPKAHAKSSTRDWRLDHCLKARWWAQIEMEQGSREHPDLHHVAVDCLVEHARYMQEFADSSDSRHYPEGPYADIEEWFESDREKTDLTFIKKLTKDMDKERAARLAREMEEDARSENEEGME